MQGHSGSAKTQTSALNVLGNYKQAVSITATTVGLFFVVTFTLTLQTCIWLDQLAIYFVDDLIDVRALNEKIISVIAAVRHILQISH